MKRRSFFGIIPAIIAAAVAAPAVAQGGRITPIFARWVPIKKPPVSTSINLTIGGGRYSRSDMERLLRDINAAVGAKGTLSL